MAKKPRWTEEDQATLENNYGLVADAQLARQMHRTVGALRQRALKTGLLRTSNFLTARAAGRILGVDSKTIAYWIRHGRMKGKKSTVVGVGANCCVWHITWEDLELFLKEQAHYYDIRRIDPVEYAYFRRLAEKHVPKGHIPKQNRDWTSVEDAVLLNNPTLSYKALAARLRRTREAIHARLALLRERGHIIPYKAPYKYRQQVREDQVA